ncbi:MAG: hypothetical protein II387_07745, partial [Oscillospiraceae bacterium]|nr:hypothetical protein [Oscillospiraceae bacterium]
RYKSTAWICDILFVFLAIGEIYKKCDIRLRRVICLRAWVDLYHIAFCEAEYIAFAKQIYRISLKRDISLKNQDFLFIYHNKELFHNPTR